MVKLGPNYIYPRKPVSAPDQLQEDIKAEPKDETSGQSELYNEEEEFKYVFKQEITDDPLEDEDIQQAKNSSRPGFDHSQDLKIQPKESPDSLGVKEYNYVIKHEIIEEEDPLGEETSSKAVKQEEEEVNSNTEDSTTNSTIYLCNRCDVSFTLPQYLEKHVKSCPGKKKTVRISTKNLTSDLKSLARFVNGRKLFFCQFCEYTTEKFGRLKRHQVIHTGVRNYVCEDCNKSYTQSHHLAQHRQTHFEGKVFKRAKSKCDFSTKTKSNFAEHRQTLKVYKCAKCDFSTKTKSNLSRHVLIHSGEKMYVCKLCTYKTVESGMLKRHMMVHSGDKPYACTMCEYKATQHSSLTRHIKRKHSGDRLFSCAHCDYSAFDKDCLKQHLRIHSGEKPFCCEYCQYRSSYSSYLRRHVLAKHSNDKPFSCHHCQYATATKQTLRRHLKLKHTDKSQLVDHSSV